MFPPTADAVRSPKHDQARLRDLAGDLAVLLQDYQFSRRELGDIAVPLLALELVVGRLTNHVRTVQPRYPARA